jgi:hypothetical protein
VVVVVGGTVVVVGGTVVVVGGTVVVVTGGVVVVGWGWGWGSSTTVVVVVPSGLVTVVTRVRRDVVVVVVVSVVVVVVSAVVVRLTEDDVVRGTVVRVLRDTTSSRGSWPPGDASGVAPARDAMVAKIVDTATPDAASSTWGDTRGRVRSGSGVSYNGSPKVCRTSLLYQPKFWVQYQPRVSRPTPMVVNPQFRMLRRCPSEFIQAFMTCSAERWPMAMFSPPGFG